MVVIITNRCVVACVASQNFLVSTRRRWCLIVCVWYDFGRFCIFMHTQIHTQTQAFHLTDSLIRLEMILATISLCSHIYCHLISTEVICDILWCQVWLCELMSLPGSSASWSKVHPCVYKLCFNCWCLWILYSGWRVAIGQPHRFLTLLHGWMPPIVSQLCTYEPCLIQQCPALGNWFFLPSENLE